MQGGVALLAFSALVAELRDRVERIGNVFADDRVRVVAVAPPIIVVLHLHERASDAQWDFRDGFEIVSEKSASIRFSAVIKASRLCRTNTRWPCMSDPCSS